jgi:hypothetical protein
MFSLRTCAVIVIALSGASAAQAQTHTKTYVTTVSKDGRTATTTGPNGTWTRTVSKSHDGSKTITSTYRPHQAGAQPMGEGGYKPMGR